jgi:hypothetical protein
LGALPFLKSKENTTLKVLANELAAVRIAMIKSERRSFMDIPGVLSEPATVYTVAGLGFWRKQNFTKPRDSRKIRFEIARILTIRESSCRFAVQACVWIPAGERQHANGL